MKRFGQRPHAIAHADNPIGDDCTEPLRIVGTQRDMKCGALLRAVDDGALEHGVAPRGHVSLARQGVQAIDDGGGEALARTVDLNAAGR